ncbi:MAG: exodeoxyribonuclease VII large subunit [Spirochaetia bacterium]|nr:exodeoxyribonuclease VII large subunit [Spirochaetia bacterium]
MSYNIEEDEKTFEKDRPLTVFEITSIVEDRLINFPALKNTNVIGEIVEFNKNPSSGHMYFTLRDKDSEKISPKKAVLRCAFFKFQNQSLNFKPEPGMEVLVTGSVSVYFQGGQYNFNVKQMRKVGEGALLLKIEQLRKKLMEEAVIDPSKRKELPLLPKRIGIVTGLGTAALRDILKQVHDRYANVEVLIAPAQVQGDAAPQSIAAALAEIAKPEHKCDVIIVGRGGGSSEDLMAFNDEITARAIYACPLPVVSAVGHQIDHPISDDVADMAASTPTDAAKIALPLVKDMAHNLNLYQKRLDSFIELLLTGAKEKWQRLSDKPFFKDPRVLIENYALLLDDLENMMRTGLRDLAGMCRERLLAVPEIHHIFESHYKSKKNNFNLVSEKLAAFSPLGTLKRGYSITYQNKKIIRKAADIDMKKSIEISFYEGKVRATPEEII